MATFDFVIDRSMVGESIGPANGFLVDLRQIKIQSLRTGASHSGRGMENHVCCNCAAVSTPETFTAPSHRRIS